MIEQKERDLLERAKKWWYEYYPLTKATDVEILRIFTAEGLVVGKLEHDIKKSFFKKQGYWEDGRTTLEAKVKELQVKKIEFGKRVAQLQNSYIDNLDEIVANIKEKKAKIEQAPQMIKNEYGIERNEVLRKFREELGILKRIYLTNLEGEIERIYDGMISDFEARREELVNQIISKFETSHQRSKDGIEKMINSLGAELEAELNILDSSKHDDVLIKEQNEEIRRINQEINSLRGLDGEIQEPQVELMLESKPIEEKPKEIFICPYCPDEEKRPFGNKGGLGSHIKGKHGDDKYYEYKGIEPPQKEENEVVTE